MLLLVCPFWIGLGAWMLSQTGITASITIGGWILMLPGLVGLGYGFVLLVKYLRLKREPSSQPSPAPTATSWTSEPEENCKPAVDLSSLSVPQGFEVHQDLASLKIGYRQFKPIILVVLIFGSIANLYGLLLLAFGGNMVIGITALGCGLALTYFCMAAILNRRTIIATRESLAIQSRPVPVDRVRKVEVYQLAQLYTRRDETITNYGTTVSYSLRAITKDNKHHFMLSDPAYERIHYLEIALEDWLGIHDMPVPEEFNPMR